MMAEIKLDKGQSMTLPDERYRSLLWAEQFLQDLMDPRKTPRVPKQIRQQARAVLRHYPSTYYIDQIARRAPDLITPRMEELHRFIKSGEPDPEVSGPLPGRERDPSL